MKVVLVLLLFVAVAVARPEDGGKEPDVDEIFANERLYKKYFDCLMDKGKCTADGQKLKDSMPKMISDKCVKCTEKQKKNVEKTVKYMLANKKDDYAKVEAKYDPEQKLRKQYS